MPVWLASQHTTCQLATISGAAVRNERETTEGKASKEGTVCSSKHESEQSSGQTSSELLQDSHLEEASKNGDQTASGVHHHEPTTQATSRRTSTFLGAGLVALSAFSSSLFGLAMQRASPEGTPARIMLTGSLVALPLTLITQHLMLHSSSPPESLGSSVLQRFWGNSHTAPWVVCRGLVGGMAFLFFTMGLRSAPLGDANAIFFSAPIFTVVFAVLILSKLPTCAEAGSTVLSIVGVGLIVKPGSADSKVGLHPALQLISAAALAGSLPVLVAKASGVHFSVLTIQTLMGVCLSCLCAATWDREISDNLFEPLNKGDMLVAAAASAHLYVGQHLLNWGLGLLREAPQVPSIVQLSAVVWSYIWQVCFAADSARTVSISTILGAVLIIVSGSFIAIFKQRDHKSEITESKEGNIKPPRSLSPILQLDSREITVDIFDIPSLPASRLSTPAAGPADSLAVVVPRAESIRLFKGLRA